MPAVQLIQWTSADEEYQSDYDESAIPEVLDPVPADFEPLLHGLLVGDIFDLSMESQEAVTLQAFGNGEWWTITIGPTGWHRLELQQQVVQLARPDGSEEPVEFYVEDVDVSRRVPARIAFGPEETEAILRHFFANGSVPERYELVPIER